ncbi:MAG: response regulator [Sediminicola sp.]|tara:strand:- start:114674 stop:115078 length:405 start_codon:yes stop_codon:yes gene_type:complete
MKKINSICIVDDDRIVVFGITKMLNATVECENIMSFSNGKYAIDAIKDLLREDKEIPSVIFLDINMPIMDGWQFLEEFIALDIPKKVYINIVTSSIDPMDRKKSETFKDRTHHTIEYKTKPIRRSEIEEITNAA